MKMETALANGITIACLDESKKLAGDRWLVKLRFRVSLPLQDWMRESLSGEDRQTGFCREQFGDHLVHEVVRERNFIDEADKDKLLAEMVCDFERNVADYLQKEAFARQLFAVKLAHFAERYSQQARLAPLNNDVDDPGPADFSDCFR